MLPLPTLGQHWDNWPAELEVGAPRKARLRDRHAAGWRNSATSSARATVAVAASQPPATRSSDSRPSPRNHPSSHRIAEAMPATHSIASTIVDEDLFVGNAAIEALGR
jgi:hypothetical protein